MKTRNAADLLYTPLVREARIYLSLKDERSRYVWLLQGLRKAYYPGGGGRMQEIYGGLVEAAGVHGIWVRRRKHSPWEIYLVGVIPEKMRTELFERYTADVVAKKLDEAHGRYSTFYSARARSDNCFFAATRTLQDKQWLKDLTAKYIDDRYRERMEPFIKRVEDGRLILRRSVRGKWSIG